MFFRQDLLARLGLAAWISTPLQRARWIQTVMLMLIVACFSLTWPLLTGTLTSSQAQTAFTLVSTTPDSGAKNVPIEGVLQFQFDQALPTDVQSLPLAIEPEANVIFDIQEDKILIQATDALEYSTDYTVRIGSQADLPLAETLELGFRTEPQYTYVDDIKMLLDASCVGCHRPQGRQRNQLLDSYGAVLSYVTPGDPDSELIDPQWTNRHAPIQNAVNPNLNRAGGSPEIAYIRQLGLPFNRLGSWTPEEVEIVTTWIVQDEAAENRDES